MTSSLSISRWDVPATVDAYDSLVSATLVGFALVLIGVRW
jgi:hypothetical protein